MSSSSSSLSTLRTREFPRLDANRDIYLDYTGAALYPQSIIDDQHAFLSRSVLGNPHSLNPASAEATRLVDRARHAVLSFFHASSRDYTLIFTANATAAIKLVAESFPFTPGATFALFADNHNSVNGVRQYAAARHTFIRYIPLDAQLTVSKSAVDAILSCPSVDPRRHNLFAFPAQSNFSGVRHPLSLIARAHSPARRDGHRWHVLLDAAAYVPTAQLDLSRHRPDFVVISFYKMFGWPTGVGALLARRSALPILRRPWYSGGTVAYATVGAGVHVLAEAPHAFEDGTLNFLDIIAVQRGIRFMTSIGMRVIGQHVDNLTRRLLRHMTAMRHTRTRVRVVVVYGPSSSTDHGGRDRRASRGGTIAFNVLAPDGRTQVDVARVQREATRRRISIRSGCFCNPGAAEYALGRDVVREWKCIRRLDESGTGVNASAMEQCIGQNLGCLRVSLGLPSNDADINAFVRFLREFAASLGT